MHTMIIPDTADTIVIAFTARQHHYLYHRHHPTRPRHHQVPILIMWFCMILLASNYGLLCLLLRQFKPLYILANSAIFSIVVFTYMIDARGAVFEVSYLGSWVGSV